MPTTITSAGITFNDATSQTTSALAAGAIGTTQLANNAVTAAKLGTTENLRIAKAWVNFNGTGTPAIRSSYNVSSITKNGTGDYTVNFATAMTDANYSYAIHGISSPVAITTGSLRFTRQNVAGTNVDVADLSVNIFGN